MLTPIILNVLVGGLVGGIIGGLVVGLVVGYFVTREVFKRQLKKNPPINEKQIRIMLSSMGRKPSEAQVRAVMRNMKNSQ